MDYVEISSLSIRDRVANGANFLDDKLPGWASEIDFEVFCITHVETCIIGQLFDNSWTQGAQFLNIEGDRWLQEFLGFELTQEEYDCLYRDEPITEDFHEAWQEEVDARL